MSAWDLKIRVAVLRCEWNSKNPSFYWLEPVALPYRGLWAGAHWLIRREDGVDKAIVDRSKDGGTNETEFFLSFIHCAIIFLMLDQTFIHLWIRSQNGF